MAEEGYFAYKGGAVRLVNSVVDPVTRHIAWGRKEKDEYTLPFGPWSFTPGDEGDPDSLSAGPWVWRYGTAVAGTGSSYRVLATRVHADIADREGGPIIVQVLSPWTAAYPFAAEGYLDESYVAEKLFCGRPVHPGDLAAITKLIRLVLGRHI